ncbi:MAG: hypothetical protein ACREJM_09085, partial [Candidatus Saccharimonadales bacterium]
RQTWDGFCRRQLFEGGDKSRLARYFARLNELSDGALDDGQRYILQELQLYGQSVVPAEAGGDEAG